MEIACPLCQNRLSIDDQYAGQLMKCPMCAGTFTAPTLGGPQAPVNPAPPQPFQMEPAPPTPQQQQQDYVQSGPPPQAPSQPQPPLPPGEYSKTLSIWFSPKVVPWIAPICLALVLLTTFLPWVPAVTAILGGSTRSFNAWSIAFGKGGDTLLAIYVVIFMLGLLASIPSMLISLGMIPNVIATLKQYRVLIVGSLVWVSWLLMLVFALKILFQVGMIGGAVAYVVAFHLHFIAAIALLLEFWLEIRKQRNLPAPKLEFTY